MDGTANVPLHCTAENLLVLFDDTVIYHVCFIGTPVRILPISSTGHQGGGVRSGEADNGASKDRDGGREGGGGSETKRRQGCEFLIMKSVVAKCRTQILPSPRQSRGWCIHTEVKWYTQKTFLFAYICCLSSRGLKLSVPLE